MNNRRTNCWVIILNILSLVFAYIFAFCYTDILDIFLIGSNMVTKNIFEDRIIDFLFLNISTILVIETVTIGTINLICAVQNKENKKLSFWLLAFSVLRLTESVVLKLFVNMEDIIDLISIIIYNILPIIIVIKNFIMLRKKKVKRIEFISYFIVILIIVIDIMGIFAAKWEIIAVIFQLIYACKQNKEEIEESKLKKVINVILYYIIQTVVVISFGVLVLYSIFIVYKNEVELKKKIENVINETDNIFVCEDDEKILLPVLKDNKYGFIDENGNEIIECQYDETSCFRKAKINDIYYTYALVKKDNQFFFINKKNESKKVDDELQKRFNIIESYLEEIYNMNIENREKYKIWDVICTDSIYDLVFMKFIEDEYNETLRKKYEEIIFEENEIGFYYENDNFSMMIEPENRDEEIYKVTVIKADGTQTVNVEYIPMFDVEDGCLDLNDGNIVFETLDDKYIGWYDSNGDRKIIEKLENSSGISIVGESVAFTRYNENNDEIIGYTIINKSLNIVYDTPMYISYKNFFMVKNENNKIVFLDANLNCITEEYDKIVTEIGVDADRVFSSFYNKE